MIETGPALLGRSFKIETTELLCRQLITHYSSMVPSKAGCLYAYVWSVARKRPYDEAGETKLPRATAA